MLSTGERNTGKRRNHSQLSCKEQAVVPGRKAEGLGQALGKKTLWLGGAAHMDQERLGRCADSTDQGFRPAVALWRS